MSHNVLFIAGLVLFDGLAVAWGLWELHKLRPSKDETASPEAPRHPEGEHGADDR